MDARLIHFRHYVVCLQAGYLMHLVQAETPELAKFIRIRWKRAAQGNACKTRPESSKALQRYKVRARFLRHGEEVCRLWFDHEQIAEIFCRLWEAESPRNTGEWRTSSWTYGQAYLKDPVPPVHWTSWKQPLHSKPMPQPSKSEKPRPWKGYQPF